MSTKCFVPNCKNTDGVPFPNEADLKKKWLESMKIKQVVPNPTSYVCLEHFEEADIIKEESEEGQPLEKLRDGAVPSIISPKKKTENGIAKAGEDLENSTQATIASKDLESTIVESCRLCMSEEDVIHHMMDKLDTKIDLRVIETIDTFLKPLKISKDDGLPQKICSTCLESLKAFHTFKSMCFSIDEERQLDLKKRQNKKRKAKETLVRITRSSKKSCPELKKPEAVEIKALKLPPCDPLQEDPLKIDDDGETTKDIKDESPEPAEKKSSLTITPSPLSKKRTEIDKKFDKVEAELRRVLEGQLTEEQYTAENIIIAVTSDDDGDEKHPTKVVLPVKEENDVKVKRNVSEQVKINTGNTQVVLPKGIRVNIPELYESEVGVFPCSIKKYLYDFQFCEVDGYIFEFRLDKGNIRYLRCISGTCRSTAVQNVKAEEDVHSITVQKPHNHKQPSGTAVKKQMFYHVMKKKMQGDKTLNFRNVYEEVCVMDPEIGNLVPLRNVINEMCRHQLSFKCPRIKCFDDFYHHIEEDSFQKLHFTHNGKQFYQERFEAEDDTKAIVFANCQVITQVSDSKLMYVDASFKIETQEEFHYQLVTILVWIEESYYPILFALVSKKTQEIYKKIFEYLHDVLAPNLRPDEIVTDYEANLYYALGETFLDSHLGGSVFYYTQNLYKKICTLNLSRDLETNSYFRNIYHMLLMLPLLPVNTILDGLNNIEVQARDLGLNDLTRPIFDHVRTQWIIKVTPDLFCVHRLENRINENVIAPFKKLRDYLMLSKGKMQKNSPTIVIVVEKLIELDSFLQQTYSAPSKKSFARDLSCSQKKNVLKAWQFIESHPKININNFFSKVLGYIKCMENQLWIWGFYRYKGDVADDLINATNFSIVSSDVEVVANEEHDEDAAQEEKEEQKEKDVADEVKDREEVDFVDADEEEAPQDDAVVMEAVIDENGGFVLEGEEGDEQNSQFENAFLKYVYKE